MEKNIFAFEIILKMFLLQKILSKCFYKFFVKIFFIENVFNNIPSIENVFKNITFIENFTKFVYNKFCKKKNI